MRFTQHTAMKAAEQIAAGTPLADIDETELSSLEAMIRAEIQDRNYRDMQQADKITYTFADHLKSLNRVV